MKSISLGKLRGMQQCSTANKTFSILALDHRNNLKKCLNPHNPSSVTDQEMVDFKLDVISELSSAGSAVLVDPQVGAGHCIASGALTGTKGLVVSLEASGYSGYPEARESDRLQGWDEKKAKRLGASAAKLLVYYHPDAPTATSIKNFVIDVSQKCAEQDLVLMLEILTYSPNPEEKKVPAAERARIIAESVRSLAVPGVDLLKLEFPVDVATQPEQSVWEKACAELTSVCPVPWVLLSASVPFEVFVKQVIAACQNGASGVAVGRAVWQETTSLSGVQRKDFLRNTCLKRMEKITSLVTAIGTPWDNYYSVPLPQISWYENY